MGAKKRSRTVTHRIPKGGPVVLNCYAELVSGKQKLAHAQLSVNVSRQLAGTVAAAFDAMSTQIASQILERVMPPGSVSSGETETAQGRVQ